MTVRSTFVSAAALLLATPAWAYDPPAKVLGSFRAQASFSGVASASVGTDPAFVYAAGEARRGSPITARSKFDIGSIGKMLTAVAVLQLVETGKVELEAPVGHYLPELPASAGAQSVQSLLAHRAGFGDVLSLPGARNANNNHDFYRLAVQYPVNSPGEYSYSNSGYVVLGELISRVSGQSYEAYLRKHVLRPAGMSDAAFGKADHIPNRDAAIGYVQAGYDPALSEQKGASGPFDLEATPMTGWTTSAAGGLYATSADITAFGRALLRDHLISRGSFERMCPAPAEGEPMVYGLGCIVMSDGGIGHNGERPGMEAIFLISRRADAVVVTLSNHDQQAEPLFWPLWEAVIANPGARTAP